MCDVRFAICGAPPHGTTLRLRLVRCTPHCAPSSLVRGYWDFAPSGLLKEILNSPLSTLHSPLSILHSHRVLRRHHHIADAELEGYEAGLAEFDVRYLFAFVVGDDRDGLCLNGIPAAAHVIEQ